MNEAILTQKDIAQQHCHDAWCVGVDSDGGSHFWSQYHQTVIVVNGTDADVFELGDTPCNTLGCWKQYVKEELGWSDCRIGGSLADEVAEAVQ